MPLYVEALADIPPELLAKAVQHAIVSNPFFPKPADLRAAIADELGHHRWQQERERLAALPAPPEPARPSAEEVAEVDALVARALQAIAGRRDDLAGPTEPA